MRLLRPVKLIGTVILVLAVPFLIFAPDSRPSLQVLGIAVGAAAAAGLASALVFRYFVPLERRIHILRSLNPRLARRLVPPRQDEKDGEGSRETHVGGG